MATAQVDAKIREDRRKAAPSSLALAAMVLLLLDKLDKAKEYSDRAYKLNPTDIFVILTKGWCSLTPDDLSQNPGNTNLYIYIKKKKKKKKKKNVYKINTLYFRKLL